VTETEIKTAAMSTREDAAQAAQQYTGRLLAHANEPVSAAARTGDRPRRTPEMAAGCVWLPLRLQARL